MFKKENYSDRPKGSHPKKTPLKISFEDLYVFQIYLFDLIPKQSYTTYVFS